MRAAVSATPARRAASRWAAPSAPPRALMHGHARLSGIFRCLGASARADARLFYRGHVLTVAPTGTGKGIGAVIPNLLTYEGSALVLDVKGENYHVTARARAAMGHEICLIDPFGVITGAKAQAFNWLDAIDLSSEDCVGRAGDIADFLVVSDGDKSENAGHFNDSAHGLLRGLILYAASLPPARRHMGEVRRLLTLPWQAFEDDESLLGALSVMAVSDAAFGTVKAAAAALMWTPERERGSVLATARRHTDFLEDPRLKRALASSDFSLGDLKSKAKTVYLVLPPGEFTRYSRFVRGAIGLALQAVTSVPPGPRPVAFMLDEFAQLGYMKAIEDAITVVRGYGTALWIFVQDLSQLKAVYPKWQSFLANAAQQYFGVSDYDTAHYVSSMLGQRTVEFHTRSYSQSYSRGIGGSSGESRSQHFAGRALLTPDEVMNCGHVIVFIGGERPYAIQRLNYLWDQEYAGLADPNPYYAPA